MGCTSSKRYESPPSTTVQRKAPSIEKTMSCTLEELCYGGIRKFKITRDIITDTGMTVQEQIVTINITPGWKKGTKITFERKGNERPGIIPADLIFIVDEKEHEFFDRLGDDLMLVVEIPLVQALTVSTITVPLLGEDEQMELPFGNTIIYPGYEKIIHGLGMPKSKDNGRGDLKLKFLVRFPEELSDQQRSEFVSILEDCS